MRFHDTKVFADDKFTVGKDVDTGYNYLSIPVRNPYVEYSEYYALPDENWAIQPVEHLEQLRAFAQKCRLHEADDKLLQKPRRLRGDPI